MSARKGNVFLDEELAGQIEETEQGMRFRYTDAWLARKDARPISLTIPLGQEPLESKGVHPFFENLLPEGWLFEIALSSLKLSRSDPFVLLLALCRDCHGAVRIEPDHE